jgi:hypothetical protein
VRVSWTRHAEEKLEVLRRHGVELTSEQVESVLSSPLRIVPGYAGRLVAIGELDQHHIVRVVFEQFPEVRRIVTLYPVRKDRNEKDHL